MGVECRPGRNSRGSRFGTGVGQPISPAVTAWRSHHDDPMPDTRLRPTQKDRLTDIDSPDTDTDTEPPSKTDSLRPNHPEKVNESNEINRI